MVAATESSQRLEDPYRTTVRQTPRSSCPKTTLPFHTIVHAGLAVGAAQDGVARCKMLATRVMKVHHVEDMVGVSVGSGVGVGVAEVEGDEEAEGVVGQIEWGQW